MVFYPQPPASDDEPVHPLVRFAVERRVTLGMLLLGVMVLGALALQRLPLEFLPLISSSQVSVRVPYDGSSPEEVARRIVRPLEDSFGTLNRLERMSSSASADSAQVGLAFSDGTDMDLATVEVRDRIDRVRHLLPDDLRQIRVRRFQTTDIPVLRIEAAVEPGARGWDQDRLYLFIDQVVLRRLQRLEGVAQAEARGLRTREVEVRLAQDRLAAHGVDVREVATALRQNHVDLSAGYLEEDRRRLLVRVVGELETLDEIRRLPLRESLRLGDVAEVVYVYPEQESFDFLNGEESLSVRVYKTSNANLLEVVDRAKAELVAIAAEPQAQGFAYRIFHDSSVDVRKGLAQLRNAGLVGGGLAICAVFLFLRRWRTTLLVAVAIPVSVVFTFVIIFLMRQAGWTALTLNVVSLMGLVLALGMLVDNSIVVIESIYRRLERLGEDARTAALRGASEVALPILASTATTLCVFVPVVFLGGGSGFFSRYLVEIGTTVCIVMVASLLVALTVVPMVASFLLARERPRRSVFFNRLGEGYNATLRFTLRHRAVLSVVAIGILYASWQLFGSIERAFSARTQAREITINVDVPRNFSAEQTKALFERVVAILDRERETLEVADVAYSYFIGGGRARGFGRQREIELFLKDEAESELTTAEVLDKLQALLPVEAGVEFSIGQSQRGPRSASVEVELMGPSPEVLELLGREVAGRLAAIPGVRDVDLSLESGDDEIHVAVDRERALQAGISSEAVARTVQNALSDRALATLKTPEREVDLVMRYREADSATLRQLGNVEVRAAASPLPLDALARFETVAGPRTIERENRQSKITVIATPTSGRASRRVMMGTGAVLGQMAMPPGYSWTFGRWTRTDQEDEAGSNFALLFALVLVYMLMASLFESLTQPLSIMLAVPFAFIGVGLVMKLANQPRDSFTQLGFIILIGVVVNNAIVLIDHVNRLRRQGSPRDQAILDGGRHRLRAILMTAITTILGLLPMVAPILFPEWLGPVEGRAGTWAPVGLVILGGLTTSTFLTLLILPTLYSLIDDAAVFMRRVVHTA